MIGIIGGLGYESTVYFQSVLMRCIRERLCIRAREVVPTLVWNVVPPGKECVLLDDDHVLRYILAGERCLRAIGATTCVLPCNTHCHVANSDIVSMYDSLIVHLEKSYNHSVMGILATDATLQHIRVSLPSIAFETPAGKSMTDFIRQIESGVSRSACFALERIIADMDATVIVVACSDLSLCLRRIKRRVNVFEKTFIDAHRVLADAVVDRLIVSSH